MQGSQIYIGTQNGVVLCVDGRGSGVLKARFFTSYSKEPTEVHSWDQLFFEMESFFDEIHFPFPTTNSRTFTAPEPRTYSRTRKAKVMKDEELLMKHGDLGSFIIRVQHRQNSSWQGRITWIEKNQTMYFRSVLELMKLMESALDSVSGPEDDEVLPSWPTD